MTGEPGAAIEWALRVVPDSAIHLLDKADLKWRSRRGMLAGLRSLSPDAFTVLTGDLRAQSGVGGLILLGFLSGARLVVIGDHSGNLIRRSPAAALILTAPRFALELLSGYGVILPLSSLLTLILGLLLPLGRSMRSVLKKRTSPNSEGSRVFMYVRGNISPLAHGGMPTHVEGLLQAASATGRQALVIECTEARRPGSCEKPNEPRYRLAGCIVISPSTLMSATKQLFYLWNNLVFTAKSLFLVMTRHRRALKPAFIYQRYSRFNWTGVALSIVTGLPLTLEFNSSEVWVARHWNPVGGLGLLERFERLNLKAADLVVAVSEVGRDNLISAGVRPERIIVNANGADTDVFMPGCGGARVRCELGAEDKTVVGFVGTFGPWHGAAVLARAALLVRPFERFHFVFIGSGEERQAAESIFNTSQAPRATFTGWIGHERVPCYLDACDVLVSPQVVPSDGTRFFGSPTKLFESMAMGRPVIASGIGQIRDLIVDGYNGLLVEPGDPVALAAAIQMLAGDEQKCRQMGAAARQTILERYTWRHNVERVFSAVERFV